MTTTDAVAAQLSLLDRFLPLWILLSAALGLGLGQLSAVHRFIDATTVGSMNVLVGIGLLFMMYPPLANVRWNAVHVALRDWRLLLLTTVQNWIVGPLAMCLLSTAFFHDQPGFMAGFSLVGCARCIGMVMIWIVLAGGDAEYAAAIIAVNSVITMALYAPYASVLLHWLPKALHVDVVDHVHITMLEIAVNVLIYMGIPFACAIAGWLVLTRIKGDAWYYDSFAARLDVVALLALLFTIVVLFASQSQRITSTIGPVLYATVPYTIYGVIVFTSSFAMSVQCGATCAQCVTLAFTATSNNYELSLGVAVATFGLDSDEAMMSVVAALIEIPIMLVLVHASLWCERRWFPDQRAARLRMKDEGYHHTQDEVDASARQQCALEQARRGG
ncbi:TPA: hypothetical protein N0F65_009009 [Lagenidium giganteum]|uniref:Arsenical-resistance protein n=1 Tax=Lagenidium giganteum TaxID=4803 RepID=A0AAV2YEM3_9STRA|nr:TPA: hypothetical protein N0F65_009009 [Lagenidium giganteum]